MRLLTPRGTGGVAVVALEGPCRYRTAASLLRVSGRPWAPSRQGGPTLGTLHLQRRALDRVLIVERPALARVEVHMHGSPAVLAALGVRPGRAEGTVGPADLLLRHALSDAQLELALEQRDLDFAGFLDELRGLPPERRRRAADRALQRSAVARALAEPERLVLFGARNAGKSTVLNLLLVRERALAGEQPGLTRDPVRELTCLQGYPYELVDTAGSGPSGSELETAAQERGRRELPGAWRLLIVDGSRGPGPGDAELVDRRTLVVCNKDDLPRAPWRAPFAADLRLSCLCREGWAEFRRALGDRLRERRGLPKAGPVGGAAAMDAAQHAALVQVREGATSR